MVKTIYHGSSKIIEKPLCNQAKVCNDYGHGFYCTDHLNMAKEWGVSKGQNGYANIYEIDCAGLDILDLNSPEYCILHWLNILLQNREFDSPAPLAQEAKEYLLQYFPVDSKEKDVIIGYRADNSYFSFAQDFINGTISYRQLNNAMHLAKMGQQFVLKSKTAFERIQFLGYEEASCQEWFVQKMQRDRAARRQYFDTERNKRQRDDLYIMQIMDEEMRSNDSRLR